MTAALIHRTVRCNCDVATMFPRTLLAGDRTSPGEQKVFAALREQLGDGGDVFHSVGILRGENGGAARDAEIDFVLAHPERGVVCLETDQQYALRELLHEHTGIPTQKPKLARDVVLADVPVHALVLGPDASPEIVVDRGGVRELAPYRPRYSASAIRRWHQSWNAAP